MEGPYDIEVAETNGSHFADPGVINEGDLNRAVGGGRPQLRKAVFRPDEARPLLPLQKKQVGPAQAGFPDGDQPVAILDEMLPRYGQIARSSSYARVHVRANAARLAGQSDFPTWTGLALSIQIDYRL
ncbi:hypothetical protein [Bradyrhizobium sp. INPA03-11B]|uniref:hypothetical protein n=1 Tax=Bradyrhizobium sp. INPA03-11B TaxID=418598 RepID=UPI003390649A